jgi:hypothetical protein
MNLIVLLSVVTIPILFYFLARHYKVAPEIKPLLAAVLITGVLFSLVSLLLHALGIVFYAADKISGLYVAQLPIEHLLLCFTLPYIFINIYLILQNSSTAGNADKYSLSVSNVLMGLSIAMIFLAYSKWYMLITFSMLLLLLFYIEYINKIRFMLRFYLAFVIALGVFLVIFIPLNVFAVLRYDVPQTIELKIAYIPFESYFCFFNLSLISIFLFEYFKRKA